MPDPAVRRYTVVLEQDPQKVLRKLPAPLVKRLLAAMRALEDGPHPHGSLKLKGHDLWRMRVGDWRIIYGIEDERLVILVLEIAPRSGAYRHL